MKCNGPVILEGFNLDPRAHRDTGTVAFREVVPVLVLGRTRGREEEEASREGGRTEELSSKAVLPIVLFTAIPFQMTQAQTTVLHALWLAASGALITLLQLLDLIQNVLEKNFGLPVGSSMAYLHVVIGVQAATPDT